MRLNIEDEDFVSSKLRMAAALYESRIVRTKPEHAILGLLSNLWYYAINELKTEVSIKDIARYTGIYIKQDLENIVHILTECEYLQSIGEGVFRIVGKEKDFEFKETCAQKAQLARDKKKLLAEKRDKKPQLQNVVKRDNMLQNVVNGGQKTLSTDLCTELSTDLHYITDHNITVTEQKKDFITSTSSSVEKVKPSQIVRKKYFELYEKKFGEVPVTWGAAENTRANALLSSMSLSKCLEYLEKFFQWENKYVIDSGYSFCKGANSFVMKIMELQADILRPERRAHSSAIGAASNVMALEQKKKIEHMRLSNQAREKSLKTQSRLDFKHDASNDNDLNSLITGMYMHYKLRCGLDAIKETFEKLYPGEKFTEELAESKFPRDLVNGWFIKNSESTEMAKIN